MLEVLKYILPALVVLVATWIVMSKQMKNEDNRRNFELRKNAQTVINPIRLRGYERLALFLERTTPEHLLMNMDLNKLTPLELQQQLLQQIRLEFDHNVSQQIYVSNEVWGAIVLAKEEMLRFVNTCRLQMPPESTTLQMAQLMLTAYHSNGETPHEVALNKLKNECRTML